MAWLRIKGKTYRSVDGDPYGANGEGDMIWDRDDALRIAENSRDHGMKVRIIKRKMGGKPYWMDYESKRQ